MINFLKLNRLVLISFFVLFTGCKSKKVNCLPNNIENITLDNKAKYFYGGLDYKKVDDKNLIKKICREISSLKNEDADAVINANYGYVEVNNFDKHFFDIIFSEYDGPIVQFSGKSYKDPQLVKLITQELNMDYEKIVNINRSKKDLLNSKYKGEKNLRSKKLVREIKKDSLR